jgi:hypothetical protein
MAVPGAVFISPHHDDVCFSLAGMVVTRRGGQLVNVFTQSDYAVVPMPFFEDRGKRIKYITDLRTAEDLAFAHACKLTRHDLMLEESSALGIHPFDLTGIGPDVELLDSVLIEYVVGLARQLNASSNPTLYCPMGIGGHRNHVAVLLAVVKALPRLRNLYEICFYEDLHYASRGGHRNAGLSRFLRLLRAEKLNRRVLLLAPELFAKKMTLVQGYRSQHRRTVRTADFIPAAPDVHDPHEAVWVLSS